MKRNEGDRSERNIIKGKDEYGRESKGKKMEEKECQEVGRERRER